MFSFFSEKNGVFNEDWVLVTSPPIKSVNLNLHLNGMCYLVKEKYSQPIGLLDNSLHKSAIKTAINEMVVDLISSIREEAPPLPDMSDPNVFKFYFTLYNKEYK